MNKIGIVLAVILLLLTINSTVYFLGTAKASLTEWITFNACAPSSIAYLIGFAIYMITGDRTALHIAILPLFFFGTLGLYVFPWGGYNIIPQISHLCMTFNVVWVLCTTFMTGDFKQATIGFIIGIALFAPFINFQQNYVLTHPDACKKILGISIEDFQEKMHTGK